LFTLYSAGQAPLSYPVWRNFTSEQASLQQLSSPPLHPSSEKKWCTQKVLGGAGGGDPGVHLQPAEHSVGIALLHTALHHVSVALEATMLWHLSCPSAGTAFSTIEATVPVANSKTAAQSLQERAIMLAKLDQDQLSNSRIR